MQQTQIGMFDSGVGGLSIWREVVKRLPAVSICYYADQAHCPYGAKSAETIRQYSQDITAFLLSQGCKLIVVACNTATAAAIQHLRERYPAISFVGLEPALKPAAAQSQSGHIGVLATAGTFQGEHFRRTQARFAHGVQVHTQIGHGLVEWVEAGAWDSQQARHLLARYLQPMLDVGVDQIVLGCTHYPFFLPILKELVQERAHIIDPAPAVARQIEKLWEAQSTLEVATPTYRFFTSGPIAPFEAFLNRIWTLPLRFQTSYHPISHLSR